MCDAVRCCCVRATHVCCSVLQCIAALSRQHMCAAACCSVFLHCVATL